MFESERLLFRKIRLEDAKDIFIWTSDPRINKFVIYPLNKSADDTINWIKTIKEDDNEFLIVEKETNKTIGSCSLTYSNEYDGYLIGVNFGYDFCGKGYGKETMLTLEKYAKEVLGIKVILGRVFKENEVSINMCKKIGYNIVNEIYFTKSGSDEKIPCYLFKKEL